MSYSKFHYIEQGLKEVNEELFKQRFTSREFALCYLVYFSKKQNINLDKTVAELIELLEKKEEVKKFLKEELAYIANSNLKVFSKVEKEELQSYLINYQKEKKAFYGEKLSYELTTPWEVAKISSLILEPKITDSVGDFWFGIGDFACTFLDNFQVSSFDGYELNYEHRYIGELIADVKGYNISLITADIRINPPEKQKYTKIFFRGPYGIEVLDRNLVLKTLNEDFIKKVKRLKSEYIHIQRVLDSLKEDGKAVVVIPLNILFSKDGFIDYLISKGYINAVIQIAQNIMPGTSIPFALLVLSFNNKTVKLVDARDIFTKGRIKNILSSNDIDRISFAYFEDESEITKYVTYEDVKNYEFDLSLNNYFYEKKIHLEGVDCEYRSLSDLCTTGIRRGVQYKAEELNSKSTLLPTNNFYLSANSIQENKIINELPNLSDIENKNLSYCLEEGDLVLANVNTSPLKVAVVKDIEDKKIVASSTVFVIRLNKNVVLPMYIKMLFESEICQKVFSIFNSGSAFISADFLNTLQIPVLPMEQQTKIVAEYLTYEEKITALKAGISSLESEQRGIIYSLNKRENNENLK